MRMIRRLFMYVIGLVVILVLGAYALPREVTVKRGVVIDAPVETVFLLVNSLKRMSGWSPWIGRDPAIKLVFSGPDAGVGATMGWSSVMEQVGNGTQEITQSIVNARVESRLVFGQMRPSVAVFDLTTEELGTRVEWSLISDMGMNPVGRWMGLMMDRWVGPDFETGLAHLKAQAETR